MKWSYRSWFRSDIDSYTMFTAGLFFAFVLTLYFVNHIDVFMMELRVSFVVAGVSIGGMVVISMVGWIGIRRFGGYYSRPIKMGPNKLSKCVIQILSEAGFIYEVNVNKASWYFFMKPKHVISLIPSDLNIEIFSLSDQSSSLYLGPKSEANEDAMKEVMKILNPLGDIHIAHTILSSYEDKPT